LKSLKLCTVITLFWVLPVFFPFASALAGEAKDKAMEKQFYLFNPRVNHVTGDIAYFSMIAYSIDYEKTITALKNWPKSELQALSLLLDLGFENSKYYNDFENRPMVFHRSITYFSTTVKDLSGLATYTEVISGRIGSHTQGDYGAAEPGIYMFYPEHDASPRIVGFGHDTVGFHEDEIYNCRDRQLRLYMINELWVGKVEYLSECMRAAAPSDYVKTPGISNQQIPEGGTPIFEMTRELERMKTVLPTFDSDYQTLHGR